MTSSNGQCKLCQESRPLCKSHIAPELLYRPLRNEKEQFFVLGRTTKTVQTGHFERMLCSKCERVLSRYESIFKRDWMDSIPQHCKHPHPAPRDLVAVPLSDFSSFKLFHLSVLWRAAVSKDFKIDQDISLGPCERQIATMLLEGSAGKPGEFMFFAYLRIDEQGRPVADVSQLVQGADRLDGHRYYMMSYAYCDWIFVVTRYGPEWIRQFEEVCARSSSFKAPIIPHKESHSVRFAVDLLRQLRR